MPANWQAQWMVAACQLFCSSGDQMIARPSARAGRSPPPARKSAGTIAHRSAAPRHRRWRARSDRAPRWRQSWCQDQACFRASAVGVPCGAKDDTSSSHDQARGATARNQCAAAGPQPARLARPSCRPQPAGRAEAEYRAEVRAGGPCQAARRPARHGVSAARRPSDPGGVRPRFRPRLDGRGDGRRARRDAGALPGRGLATRRRGRRSSRRRRRRP